MTEPSKDLVVQSTAYSRANLTERQQYVAALARAGDLLPQHLRGGMVRDERSGQMVQMGNLGKTFLLAETGDMLGIHPMAALSGVHIIEGKPSISANLMGGLVRKAGHTLRVTVTGSADDGTLKAVAQLIRFDDPDFTFEVTWALDDAKRAGLWPGKANSNWQKYPKAMMKARVISEVIREGAPDVLMGGNVYTPEELGAQVTESGEVIELKAEPASPKQQAPIVDERPAQTLADVHEATVDEHKRDDATAPDPGENLGENEEYAEEVTEEDANATWVERLEGAKDREEAQVLYREARDAGILATPIKWGDADTTLGDAIIAVGSALGQLERSAEEA